MAGDNDRGGVQFTADDGTTHTINSTDDKNVPNGYYHTQVDSSGNKVTAVYNSDGTLADVNANKSWD